MSISKRIHTKAQKNVPLMAALAVSLALTSLTLALVSQYAAVPVQGTIAKVSTVLHVSTLNMSPVAVDGAFASFTYPKSFTPVRAQLPSAPILDAYAMTNNELETSRLAISVMTVPSGNLADNNAYAFRRMHSSDYTESRTTSRGQQVVMMMATRSSGFEAVAFLMHGDRQAVIALSGGNQDTTSQLQAVLLMVVGSWQWHP